MRATLALNGLNRGGGVNKQGVEKAFVYFILMAQIYLCTNKVVIFGKEKK